MDRGMDGWAIWRDREGWRALRSTFHLYTRPLEIPTRPGAHIEQYLLERTRLCGFAAGERNFHVLHQLLAAPAAALPADAAARLPLGEPPRLRLLLSQVWTPRSMG